MTQKSDYGHWECEEFDPQEYFGFVYRITNKKTGEMYLGCKQLHRTVKRPPLKGRKNKRHSKKESDWREYTGSSKRLNEDIETMGKGQFKFEIIELHESRWELSYGEYKRIIMEDAIPSQKYYNEFLGRVGKAPNKVKY